MRTEIKKVEYFYVAIEDQVGKACEVLNILTELGINMFAFGAMPLGPNRTQLTLFPEEPEKMKDLAKKSRFVAEGPNHALLVQGDDQLGALAEIHLKLCKADVNVYASYGVTDGRGNYGYVLYIRPEEYQRAVNALEVGN